MTVGRGFDKVTGRLRVVNQNNAPFFHDIGPALGDSL